MSPNPSTKEELEERIKELSCLYEISSVIRNYQGDNQKTLRKICRTLKQAWRFSEAAVVELHLDGFDYCTGKIPDESVWQRTDIKIFNEIRGSLQTHYPSPEFTAAHFLPEEQKLLNKIAEEISNFYEKQHQKQKEEQLRRTAERNDRLSILGEITAGIAHELNTPLGNILGFAELINERTTNEQIRQDTSRIIRAAMISREVVKKLMFFACEMPQRMETIKVIPVVSQALSLLRPNFKKAGVEHRLSIKNEELEAQLDPIQFTQVLFNLLINALYVSPRGSTIEIMINNDKSSLLMEVLDEGPGIEEEIKSKIFEPFFTTKPIGEGSGLGLSVVHGIIKSHRGKIRIFDNIPSGTIFQIQLPLKS